jgi:hypothetical protein
MPRHTPGDDKRVFTSYERRRGEYRYDIAVYETTPPANAGRFYARVVNMVRLRSGETVSVNSELEDAYGATPDEATSTLEAAVEEWTRNQTPSD